MKTLEDARQLIEKLSIITLQGEKWIGVWDEKLRELSHGYNAVKLIREVDIVNWLKYWNLSVLTGLHVGKGAGWQIRELKNVEKRWFANALNVMEQAKLDAIPRLENKLFLSEMGNDDEDDD